MTAAAFALRDRFEGWFAGLPGPVRGTAWMLGSGMSLTLMAVVIRHVSQQVHVFEVALFRTALGLVFMAPWLMSNGLSAMRTDKLPWYVLRGAVTCIATLGYFYALAKIPLADAVAVMFSRPLYGTIFAIVFLGEIVGARRWVALAIGFAGVLVMVRPAFESVNIGLLAVLIASIAGAGSAVLVRFFARTDPPDTVAMYYAVCTTPFIAIPAIFVWVTPTWGQIAWMLLMGLLGTIGQRMLSRGFAAADASIMLPVDFCRLLFAAVFGFVLFGEIPSVYTAIGGFLIFAATVYIARRGSPKAPAGSAPTPAKGE